MILGLGKNKKGRNCTCNEKTGTRLDPCILTYVSEMAYQLVHYDYTFSLLTTAHVW